MSRDLIATGNASTNNLIAHSFNLFPLKFNYLIAFSYYDFIRFFIIGKYFDVNPKSEKFIILSTKFLVNYNFFGNISS